MKTIDLTNEKEDFTIKLPMGAFGESQDIYADGKSNNTISVKVPKQDAMDLVPKSWVQFCKMYPQIAVTRWCGLPKEEADAFVALGQLRMLWHKWIEILGEPEMDGESEFYTIYYNLYYKKFEVISREVTNHVLTFKEKSHAQEFIKCFGELLEKAKILL